MTEIYHYGVLGMKWGIRKDQEGLIRTNGGIVKAGTKFQRMTTNPNETQKGRIYVSEKENASIVNKEVSDMYKSYISSKNQMNMSEKDYEAYSEGLKKKGLKPNQLYQMDLTTTVDAILPDMKTKGEVFVNTFLKSETAMNQVSKAYIEEKFGKHTFKDASKREIKDEVDFYKQELKEAKQIYDSYKKDGKSMFDDDGPFTSMDSIKSPAFRDGYKMFLGALNDKKVMAIYGTELTKKGYNAVSDDLDISDAKNLSIGKIRSRANELNANTGLTSYLTKGGRSKLKELNETRTFLNKIDTNAEENRKARGKFTGSGMIFFEQKGVLRVDSVTPI